MSYNMRAIIGKLNPTARNVLAEATNLANASTHSSVDVQHYLARLVDATNTDAERIFRRFGVDASRFSSDISGALDRMERGAGSLAMSPAVIQALREAWTIGSIEYGSRTVRTGTILLALAADEDLGQRVRGISREFGKIDA